MRSCSASPSDSRNSGPRFTRRRFLAAAGLIVVWPETVAAQEGVFLRAEEAPRALFPEGDAVVERRVPASPELRRRIQALLGAGGVTVWEREYRTFTVTRGGAALGDVLIVEEIGKHRPITFAVAVTADGHVHDIAVLAYREAYGGEVREARFLRQYRGKELRDPLLPYRDIKNIAGATLSVEATGRAAHKALAVARALRSEG